jgi:hypothetical protein
LARGCPGQDGERDDDDHDAVHPVCVGHVRVEDEVAEQDRHRALEPGEQNEHGFLALQPRGEQTYRHQGRLQHRGQDDVDDSPGIQTLR